MRKKILITALFVIPWIASAFFFFKWQEKLQGGSNVLSTFTKTPSPTPLEKYTIENLGDGKILPGEFKRGDTLEENEKFNSYLFSLRFDSDLDNKLDKKTTGVINIPNEAGKYPVILMFRGYVDQKIYTTGTGTKNAAAYFSENGFITVAPDFLGYAGSDSEAENIFESRFQTYVTGVSLLNPLDQIEKWDGKNIFIWGHSNGGQIALTVLEITQKEIPTVLWAPVSKPFPYSILYYTDESEDHGKLIRTELAKFETLYDVEKYSLTNYFDRIKAPLQIHQGTADGAVPKEWSGNLVKALKSFENEPEYFVYPGADHNLRPDWDMAVSRSLDFFKSNMN